MAVAAGSALSQPTQRRNTPASRGDASTARYMTTDELKLIFNFGRIEDGP
jgi:hypothetical protein